MSFVDRYWEWRRRRALRAWERAREVALVADLIMERRGVSRRSGDREQALPVGETAAAPAHSERGSPARIRGDPRASEWAGLDRSPPRQAKGEAPQTAGGLGRDAPGRPAILAAIDGTRSSAEVGTHAIRLAEGLRAKLFVLSFINVAPASRMGVYRSLALAQLERDSEDMAKQTKELADKHRVKCEVRRALDPRPSRAIVAAAEEVGAYCVVIGSPGASAVDRLLDRALGGVHEKVLRRARCPVLSVR